MYPAVKRLYMRYKMLTKQMKVVVLWVTTLDGHKKCDTT